MPTTTSRLDHIPLHRLRQSKEWMDHALVLKYAIIWPAFMNIPSRISRRCFMNSTFPLRRLCVENHLHTKSSALPMRLVCTAGETWGLPLQALLQRLMLLLASGPLRNQCRGRDACVAKNYCHEAKILIPTGIVCGITNFSRQPFGN